MLTGNAEDLKLSGNAVLRIDSVVLQGSAGGIPHKARPEAVQVIRIPCQRVEPARTAPRLSNPRIRLVPSVQQNCFFCFGGTVGSTLNA